MYARAVLVVAVGALARCGACEPDRGPAPSASASASSAPGATRPPIAPSGPIGLLHPRPERPACKALSVEGDVHLEAAGDAGTTPLLIAGLVPTEGWLVLAPGARFVAKDPRTSRETAFRGPARVRACVELTEETWLASGGFDSSVGSGESPGNEEWVVSPLGVVRYTAAKLAVDVRPRDVRAVVASGGAFVWSSDDASTHTADGGVLGHTDDGWLRAEGGTVTLSATSLAPSPVDAARGAVSRCTSLGRQAHDLGALVMAGGADAGTIAAQVGARRLARAACAVAGLRLAAQPPRDALDPLVKSLAEGNAAWSQLPSPP